MARIRTIKPTFFKSEDVSVLPFRTRLTWVGLWTFCDDQGRAKDNAKLIKGDVWPLDEVSLDDIEDDLVILARHGRIVRYEVAGARYLAITNWDHQRINKPTPSRTPGPSEGTIIDAPAPGGSAVVNSWRTTGGLPESYVTPTPPNGAHSPVDNPDSGASPQVNDHSRRSHVGLPEDSRNPPVGLPVGREGKGKEGKGRDAGARPSEPAPADAPRLQITPPPKCPDHINDPQPPPCRACADHRKAREAWDRGVAEGAALAQSERARAQAAANRAAVDACRNCDNTGRLADATLCSHDPDSSTRSQRGGALARAALTRRPATEEPS